MWYLHILLLLSFYISRITPLRHANLRTTHLYHTALECSNTTYGDLPVINEAYISSKIDHFNNADVRTYQQRVYSNSQYYTPNSAVFIYIGGEAELTSKSIQQGEIVANAKLYGAMLHGIEHRYYGASQPFSTLDTVNLQYLTSQQALADLADFIISIKQDEKFKNSPIVVFGGSYPGSLSSWARLKYPHLIDASIASSAPTLATLDFYQYDLATQAAIGDTCTNNIVTALNAVETALNKDNVSVKQQFQCTGISDDVNFLYVLADAVSYSAQYTSNRAGARYHLRDFLCDTFANTTQTPYDNYVQYVTGILNRLETNCVDFSTSKESLSDTSISPDNNQRQWYYQSCNEFGYFQSAPQSPHQSLRSSRITVDWHLQLCQQVFQQSMTPAITHTNTYYQGDSPTGSNIVYVNGLIDPWHTLSVLQKQPCCTSLIPVISSDTSHCADLAPVQPDDPVDLVLARQKVTALLAQWTVTTPD